MDKTTVAVVRDAMAQARAGRIGEACSIAERGLVDGGEVITLNALLGALRAQAGEHEAAIPHLEVAHAGRPADVRIASNLANALTAVGQLQRALEIASPELAFADPTLQLARTRGYLGQMLDRPEIAVCAYEHVVQAAQDDWASWNNLGNARVAAGDAKRGIADLQRAVSLAPDAPPARLNLARAYRQTGDLQKAEQLLRQMADDFPSDAMPLKDLHDILMQSEREGEVLPVIDRALERDPDNLELLLARAGHLGLEFQMEEAETAFREILRRDPVNEEAFVGLAILYEHSKPSDLADLADEAEASSVGANAINLLRAFSARRSKEYATAVEALNKVAPEFESLRRSDLLGQMLEKLGDYDGAFAAFDEMNALQTQDTTRPVQRAAAIRSLLESQLDRTTPAWVESWKVPPVEPAMRAPIFLVGFPRSGTTLLDTILMGHPNAVVMEERPALSRLKSELGGFGNIAVLDEEQIRTAQSRYFELATEYVRLREGSVLVDKSPLLMNEAAFIHRIFPTARFILVLRHPADVLLSCFVSNFRLNSAMANFLRLDTAAEFYDLTFRTWENARQLLPLGVHTVVYEEMVQDPPTVLRPVVEALGLDWHQDMLDHTKTAAERGLITTASYAQVTQPIYTRSVGRWERYRKHLEPVLPVLAPWIEKFGYTI